MIRHSFIALLAVSLFWGCSEDSNSLSSNTGQQLELAEESAVVVAASVGLDSGGLLVSIESVLEDGVQEAQLNIGKSAESDDAVFDPESCTWTIHRSHSREGLFAGFERMETRTLHFMDEAGDCIEQPDGSGNLRALDFTREFSGSSWNRRHEGQKSGVGSWEIRELNDDDPGARVNGNHQASGEGLVRRFDEEGQPVEIEHSFVLSVEGSDLLVLQRDGRRIPVEGTLHIVYDAVRGDHVIHREITLTFGDGDARMDFGQELSFLMDTLSGELIN